METVGIIGQNLHQSERDLASSKFLVQLLLEYSELTLSSSNN